MRPRGSRPSTKSSSACARSTTSATRRSRRPCTSPTGSASRCSSRARPASARPSSRSRSRRRRGLELVRLQCYEGLDEARALYEWNYRKQLLRIQADEGTRAPLGGDPGEHLRRAVPARASAAEGDPLGGARRAARRRDRPDGVRVRGVPARAAVRLPGDDPRDGDDGRADAPDGVPHVERDARAVGGAEAPLRCTSTSTTRRRIASARSSSRACRSFPRRSRTSSSG